MRRWALLLLVATMAVDGILLATERRRLLVRDWLSAAAACLCSALTLACFRGAA